MNYHTVHSCPGACFPGSLEVFGKGGGVMGYTLGYLAEWSTGNNLQKHDLALSLGLLRSKHQSQITEGWLKVFSLGFHRAG